LLLLQKKRPEYAELLAKTVLPLLVKMWDPEALEKIQTTVDLDRVEQMVLMAAGAVTLLPLVDPDFLAVVPNAALMKSVPDLTTIAARAKDEFTQHGTALVLFAVARKLGLEKEPDAVTRLKGRDANFDDKNFDRSMRDLLGKARELLRTLTARQ
jgi:hypothetical protein